MEDVSDPPFRALCKEGGADVVYTEFISSEGLIRDAAKSVQKLDIYEKERPVGIQIFGANLDSMLRSVEIVEETNPDIIDINFGCPVKKVVCKGAGAGILKDIPKMVKLTEAMVKHTNIPVTVKTRLGWDLDSIKIVEVAERLQDAGCAAISIHVCATVLQHKTFSVMRCVHGYGRHRKRHPDHDGEAYGAECRVLSLARFDGIFFLRF